MAIVLLLGYLSNGNGVSAELKGELCGGSIISFGEAFQSELWRGELSPCPTLPSE